MSTYVTVANAPGDGGATVEVNVQSRGQSNGEPVWMDNPSPSHVASGQVSKFLVHGSQRLFIREL